MESYKPSEGSQMNKPAQVKQAQYKGDTEALKAMGRAGAKARTERLDADRMMEERIKEQRLMADHERRHESGEDIIPIETYE